MNRLQKIALYQLIVIFTALGVAVIVWVAVCDKGWEQVCFFGLIPLILLVFVHFDRMFFPIKAGEIVYDERDETIKKKAVVTVYTIFWIIFTFGCVIPLFVLGPNATIPIYVLPWMLVCAAIVVRVVWSIAILIQYGWGDKNGK
jgi:hypothetical protein